MPMSVGSVTVNPDGTWTGSGAALAIMNVIQPMLIGEISSPTQAITVGISKGAATVSQSIAAIITYISTNARVTIPAGSLGGGIPASDVHLDGDIS